MLVNIGTFPLVGGTRATGMGIKWDDFSHQRGVEVYYPIRGAAKTRDSGNDVTQLSFRVTREFETIEDAQIFLADHPAEVPRSGLVQFISTRDNGQEITRYLQDAKCTGIALSEPTIGVTVTLRYSFVGSSYTKTVPTT